MAALVGLVRLELVTSHGKYESVKRMRSNMQSLITFFRYPACSRTPQTAVRYVYAHAHKTRTKDQKHKQDQQYILQQGVPERLR